MTTIGRWAAVAVLMAAGMGLAGCVVAAAGAAAGAGVAYVNGNAEKLVEAAPDRVVASAEAVFREMEIKPGEREENAQDRQWQLHGKTPKGTPVKVTVRQVGKGDVCKVWVRVGTFGDENYSRTVIERIEARL